MTHLVYAQASESTTINLAISTAAPAYFVSSKIYDGLLAYNPEVRESPYRDWL